MMKPVPFATALYLSETPSSTEKIVELMVRSYRVANARSIDRESVQKDLDRLVRSGVAVCQNQKYALSDDWAKVFCRISSKTDSYEVADLWKGDFLDAVVKSGVSVENAYRILDSFVFEKYEL